MKYPEIRLQQATGDQRGNRTSCLHLDAENVQLCDVNSPSYVWSVVIRTVVSTNAVPNWKKYMRMIRSMKQQHMNHVPDTDGTIVTKCANLG